MSSNLVLKTSGLCKDFKIYDRIRRRFQQLFSKEPLYRIFTALQDISFSLERGRIMGVIGENGSGKSTLLKIIAGVLLPDAGQVERNGEIAGLLELGTGFNMELSGRRNIFINGAYLNMSPKELRQKEESIIEFSGLPDFIDAPIKSYSSGMVMRLAFSIAIHSNPACFIIDEALSVGDARFQQKCFDRLREFKAAGGSILFVSHDLNAVKLLCDSAMLLDHGRMVLLGDPSTVVDRYAELLAARGDSGARINNGYGNGAIHFTSLELLDRKGMPAETLTSGDPLTVRFAWDCLEPARDIVFGMLIRDRFGQDVFGTNGAHLKKLANVEGPGSASFHLPAMNIGPGLYTVDMAAHTGTTHLDTCYHWWEKAAAFQVVMDEKYFFSGHTRLAATLEMEKNGEV